MYTLKKEDKETEAKRDEEKRVSVSESAVCFLSSSGTVNPTHYHVVHHQGTLAQLPPERLQNFTFRLTHMYYNWPVRYDSCN